jgi:DNA polymerase-3 subunit delta'
LRCQRYGRGTGKPGGLQKKHYVKKMIVGHQKIWQYLSKSAEQNKLNHAFLFSGEEQLGKRTLALEFAKLILKEDITKKQHPDFIFIWPEKKEIQIPQIRECIWRMSLKPSVAPYKIAVIDQAHCLNQEAQNCLLKTLEEPKGNSLILLITDQPERLLPTILSRCQTLKFYPVPKEEIKKYLKTQNISEIQTQEIVDVSDGRPGTAIDLVKSSDKLKNQKALIADFIKISNSDLAIRFQYADNLAKEPQNIKETLDVLLRYFRQMLISGVAKVSDSKYSFENKLDSAPIAKLKNIVRIIQETNFLISSTNANPRLALEILMLEF